MARQGDVRWEPVAALISQLGLVHSDMPTTAAQVRRMPLRQLLQDPVRAAIYNRGWDDRTADVERRLRPQQPATPSSSRTNSTTRQHRPQPAGPSTHRVNTGVTRAPAPVPPREPAPVPVVVGGSQPTVAEVRTEAQQARIRKKFQKLKEKRLERERQATQAYRLAKRPRLTSNTDTASCPPTEPTPPEAMEVDQLATKDETSKDQGDPTNQAQPRQASDEEQTSYDAWLNEQGKWLEELQGGGTVYPQPFFTPATSPTRE